LGPGVRLLPAGHDRVLELARDEVVRHGVEDEPPRRALHPAGLTGEDQLGADARRAAGVSQETGRRALAEAAIRAEHRQARRSDGEDLAGPEVQVAPRR